MHSFFYMTEIASHFCATGVLFGSALASWMLKFHMTIIKSNQAKIVFDRIR